MEASNADMAPVAEAPVDQRERMAKVARDHYDSDDIFNYCQQVWGGEYIHVGVYTKFEGEDNNLKGVQRIAKASSINTEMLLSLCFPGGNDGGDGLPASDKCTLMDMGAGLGGTARVAVKEYGCDVCKPHSMENMATVSSYKQCGEEYGLEFVEFVDLIENFPMHFTALIEVLEAEGKDLKGVRQEFVAKTLIGLAAWKAASDRGLMSWGMIALQKPV